MKKSVVILIFILIHLHGFAQSTYFTRNGHVYFISLTDAIDIDANNYQCASFLNIETGKIQFAVLIKSFEFTLATAKEHFNESYMESDKFPKASFKGEILNIDQLNLKEFGSYQVRVKGELTIRGITKNIEVAGEIIVEKEMINAKSEFEVAISDFDISVPKVVEHRVAKQVLVKVDMNYSPYKN